MLSFAAVWINGRHSPWSSTDKRPTSRPVSGFLTSKTSVEPSGNHVEGRTSRTVSSKLASRSGSPVPSAALERNCQRPSRRAAYTTRRPSGLHSGENPPSLVRGLSVPRASSVTQSSDSPSSEISRAASSPSGEKHRSASRRRRRRTPRCQHVDQLVFLAPAPVTCRRPSP